MTNSVAQDLSDHIKAIQEILRGREDAESQRFRAWLASFPVGRPLSAKEKALLSEVDTSDRTNFLPHEEFILRVSLQSLRTLSPEQQEKLKLVIESVAANYIHERRLFVAPEPVDAVAQEREACAKMLEDDYCSATAAMFASRIRARGAK